MTGLDPQWAIIDELYDKLAVRMTDYVVARLDAQQEFSRAVTQAFAKQFIADVNDAIVRIAVGHYLKQIQEESATAAVGLLNSTARAPHKHGAKSSRYCPCPGRPTQSSKRRRQWR